MEIYKEQNTFQVVDSNEDPHLLDRYHDEIAEVREKTIESIKQVDILKREIKNIFPESFVMVASDKGIKSVNEITPILYATDKAVATDSFLGHLAARCRVMRPDRNG